MKTTITTLKRFLSLSSCLSSWNLLLLLFLVVLLPNNNNNVVYSFTTTSSSTTTLQQQQPYYCYYNNIQQQQQRRRRRRLYNNNNHYYPSFQKHNNNNNNNSVNNHHHHHHHHPTITTSTSLSMISTTTSTLVLATTTSSIDEWPLLEQTFVFVSVYVGLGIGTLIGCNVLDLISSKVIGLEKWRNQFIDDGPVGILLGLFYLLAGIGHFTISEQFEAIYPPQGTWGIWYIPGTSEFHVTWTGIVEIIGGMGLIVGSLSNKLINDDDDDDDDDNNENNILLTTKFIQPISAFVLFLLTIIVTPANIYMFTHGAVMIEGQSLDIQFHIIRFAIQIVLLSLLLTLAKDSLLFIWGDELD